MTFPNFSFERVLWKKGHEFVAGVDEVGRGCLAGSVVAGCVVFAKETVVPKGIRIDDSKKLTAKQREKAASWIKENAFWGIGSAPASLINRSGIGKATKTAFRRAITEVRAKNPIDFLLIDAFYIPWVKGLKRKNQEAIIKGDGKSLTIGAASIIAKVYRDSEMKKLSRKYPKYGWEKNKGYGTKEHQVAIKKYGITRLHRKLFVRNFI